MTTVRTLLTLFWTDILIFVSTNFNTIDNFNLFFPENHCQTLNPWFYLSITAKLLWANTWWASQPDSACLSVAPGSAYPAGMMTKWSSTGTGRKSRLYAMGRESKTAFYVFFLSWQNGILFSEEAVAGTTDGMLCSAPTTLQHWWKYRFFVQYLQVPVLLPKN